MHIKNIVHSKMKNELQEVGTTWNKMGAASLSHAQTHTRIHTSHRRVLYVQHYGSTEYNITRCIIRTWWNIYNRAF